MTDVRQLARAFEAYSQSCVAATRAATAMAHVLGAWREHEQQRLLSVLRAVVENKGSDKGSSDESGEHGVTLP